MFFQNSFSSIKETSLQEEPEPKQILVDSTICQKERKSAITAKLLR